MVNGIDHELLETKFKEELTKNGPHLKQMIVNESSDNVVETPSRDIEDIQNNTRQYQNYIKIYMVDNNRLGFLPEYLLYILRKEP